MNRNIQYTFAMTALVFAAQAAAQITFYQGEGFRGRAFTTDKQIGNLERVGFNDRASSVVVDRGRWEVCEHARFEGRCVVLRRGSYESLATLGMNDRVSSVRPVDSRRRYENELPAPPVAAPVYEYRQRPNERIFEVPVRSVRAVMGPPDRRCWVEREHVSDSNVGGAVAGAIIGGVLGHQIGSGRGRDAATAGGAIAGAVIGSNVGREGGGGYARDVRRCETAQSGPPAYWDVTYEFKGTLHHAQMSAPPGRTILVNRDGVPRQ